MFWLFVACQSEEGVKAYNANPEITITSHSNNASLQEGVVELSGLHHRSGGGVVAAGPGISRPVPGGFSTLRSTQNQQVLPRPARGDRGPPPAPA